MTVLTVRFYRLDTAVSPTGEATIERVDIRPPVDYDSGNPAPGTEIKIMGFPPCQCPRAPACRTRENARATPPTRRAPPAAAAVPKEPPLPPGEGK
ncbi:hypothetical protein [Streptomyces sp. NPDC021020]|uniref:hypothetical protein n=1 Tax=Streptomyces sp. NPDC021020 TaxID=3365109 RepID=UPI003792BC45